MKRPALTVLIPAYNPGNFLAQLLWNLECAARSLQLPLRVEISNDRSPLPLLELKSSEWLEVREHVNAVNLGEGENVNQAIKRLSAEGVEWVLLMHQDDLVAVKWLQVCNDWITGWKLGQADFIFAENEGLYGLERFPQACILPQHPEHTPLDVHIPPGRQGIDYVSDHWAWIPSGSLLRAVSYIRMGGFHSTIRYAGDNDFMVRWLLSGQAVRQVRQKLIYKRIHAGASTARCVLLGWDSDGWCYLMQKYASCKTKTRSRQDHIAWLRRDARMALSALSMGKWRLFVSRLRGLSIALRSLLAVRIHSLRFLLPVSVHRLLEDAPDILTARPNHLS